MPIQAVPIQAVPIQVEAAIDGRAINQVDGVAIAHYQTWLQTWLSALSPQLSPINAYEVSLRLTDDGEIQQLNADYRQQPNPTDVLSFAALETDLPGLEHLHCQQPLYLGDIVISVETAARQAPAHQHSLPKEIAWLIAHGLLHLLGWDHPDEASLARMLDQQTQLLSLISIPPASHSR
ncbi:MAG: rRNA maturation RNase YbeY [Phormidesmis sp. RL_2_1]|nr:rRNA maturation RNase YbeY [Phormidesmis sp. RL_2_1]